MSNSARTNTATHTADTPQLLLEHHLKELRLPTMLREYDKVARQCAVEQVDYQHYLLRITELELLDRERRATERRIRQAKFPVVKTMDSFDFLAIPTLNKTLVLELARCEFLTRRENVLLLGNSGTGKSHIALALGLAACQRGHRVRFTTTAALVSELIEARDEKKLLRFQKQIASYELLIVDELGFVPLSKTGAELLFEMLSQRYERGSTMVTPPQWPGFTPPLTALLGDGGGTAITAQGVVISLCDGLRGLAEHRGGDFSSQPRQGQKDGGVAMLGLALFGACQFFQQGADAPGQIGALAMEQAQSRQQQ